MVMNAPPVLQLGYQIACVYSEWAILHGLASGFWGPPTGIAKSRDSEVDLQQNCDASNVPHLRHHLASFSLTRGVEQAFARHPPSKSIFGPTPSTVNLSYKRRARGAVYYRVLSSRSNTLWCLAARRICMFILCFEMF